MATTGYRPPAGGVVVGGFGTGNMVSRRPPGVVTQSLGADGAESVHWQLVSFTDATIARLPRVIRPLAERHHELIKFAIVGATTFLIDSALFYTLKLTILAPKPVTAKVIAGIVAVIASYVLNREWSFRNRGGRERSHEALLFFAFSGVGVLLSMAPLWVSSYVLQLRVPNVSLTIENIADFLSFRAHITAVPLPLWMMLWVVFFSVVISLSGRLTTWIDERAAEQRLCARAPFWTAMLGAGIFGTILGDVCSKAVGGSLASASLFALFIGALTLRRRCSASVLGFWLVVAVARTAGTAMGDWLAEDKLLDLGLPLATLVSGICFTAIVALRQQGSATYPASAL